MTSEHDENQDLRERLGELEGGRTTQTLGQAKTWALRFGMAAVAVLVFYLAAAIVAPMLAIGLPFWVEMFFAILTLLLLFGSFMAAAFVMVFGPIMAMLGLARLGKHSIEDARDLRERRELIDNAEVTGALHISEGASSHGGLEEVVAHEGSLEVAEERVAFDFDSHSEDHAEKHPEDFSEDKQPEDFSEDKQHLVQR